MVGESVIALGNALATSKRSPAASSARSGAKWKLGESAVVQTSDSNRRELSPRHTRVRPLLNIDGEMIGVNVAVRANAQGMASRYRSTTRSPLRHD